MTFSIATHGIMKLTITTVSIMDLFATLSINGIQHNDNPINIKGLYADCFDNLNVVLSVIMPNVIMLSVVAQVPH
jgi:hypothetical protein